jgi:hypothetical protein
LSQLLLKISTALQDSLLGDNTPSTVNRQVIVKSNTSCTSCLIQNFRDNRYLQIQLDVDNPALSDVSMYRLQTIFLDFIGVRKGVNSGNTLLKVLITSSGIFRDKEGGTVYDFVTSPLSLAYEYDIITG